MARQRRPPPERDRKLAEPPPPPARRRTEPEKPSEKAAAVPPALVRQPPGTSAHPPPREPHDAGLLMPTATFYGMPTGPEQAGGPSSGYPVGVPKPRRGPIRPIELGVTGTTIMGGQILQDPNVELQFPRSVAIYDKMRRTDGQVKAAVLAVTLPILSLEWDIEPFHEVDEQTGVSLEPAPADKDIATFIRKDLIEGRNSPWKRILREILGMLWAGFWVIEPVFETQDDDLIHLAKLGSRLPSSVFRWQVARDGTLQGIVQRAVNPSTGNIEIITLNAADLLMFVNEKEGADWTGQSILRAAYKHFYMKDWLYRIGVINTERGGGFPVITLPEEGTAADVQAAHDVGESIHMHERAYVIEPPLWKFRLETGTTRMADVMTQVSHHDQKISAVILAQFMDIGSESGARAMAGEFIDLFLMALEAVINNVEETVNQQLIKRWCLPPGSTVLLADGAPQAVEAIEEGTQVLSGTGRAQPVLACQSRDFSGALVELAVHGLPTPLRLTPDHQLPTQRGWLRADEVFPGDRVCEPRLQWGTSGDTASELEGWLVGFYLAEGHRTTFNFVGFTVHRDEVGRVLSQIDRWWRPVPPPPRGQRNWRRRKPRVWPGNGQAMNISLSHPELRALIETWVAGKARDKRLLQWPTDEAFAQGVLAGWLEGDGWSGKRVHRQNGVQWGETVSPALAWQMLRLAGALGYRTSLKRYDRHPSANGFHRRDYTCWRVRVAQASLKRVYSMSPQVEDTTIWRTVRATARVPYVGPVYDVTVDVDHTFLAEGVTVSNCDYNWPNLLGYPKLKAQNIRGFNVRRMGAILRMLADGKMITPDEPLESFLRKSMGLPDADIESRRTLTDPFAGAALQAMGQGNMPGQNGDKPPGGPGPKASGPGGIKPPTGPKGLAGNPQVSLKTGGMKGVGGGGQGAGGEDLTMQTEGTKMPNPRLSETGFHLGSVYVEPPADVAAEVHKWQEQIPAELLQGTGIEPDPHVTVKYGLHTQDSAEVAAALQGFRRIRCTLGDTIVFTQPDQDVVAIAVESPDLLALRARVSKQLSWEDEYATDYRPHLTLAIVKPGTGQQFAGDRSFAGQRFVAEEAVFTPKSPSERQTVITLTRPHFHTFGLKESKPTLDVKPFFYRRALTDLERCCNFQDIDQRQKTTTQRLLDRLKPIQTEQIASLVKLAQTTPESGQRRIDGITQIRVPYVGRMANAIRDSLTDIFQFGRQTVRDELQRQATFKSKQITLAEPLKTDDDYLAYLGAKADVLSERWAARLKDTALTARLRAARGGQDDERERSFIEQMLVATATGMATGMLFQGLVEAFALGRRTEAEQQGALLAGDEDEPTFDPLGAVAGIGAPLVGGLAGAAVAAGARRPVLDPRGPLAQYSAVMDANTCDICENLDGLIAPVTDPRMQVPNPDCLGEKNNATCRCVLIYSLS